ncbi:DNA replication/repair protein RecF [Roseobacter litoralis]|uniref:DNA replication and repair protein RecF n=1 Tax=Roseobacter litoralis (strain ATCC 49566 / DSM 6996 / JCM 21268 / NBRC 15278 / OCh 149) TaxID=391595 RepID=F7ZD29_ROSLO|nr:DNA replication/repair protein RecF [Roseobacter litoralis]AEI92037.1 DNA replication and repair protein RecF [Roseobacter litoralis Och 149]
MALHLTELMISHFRSHRVARLMVDARPVALFGPNGAGKTNVLEAVSLLSPGRGLRRASAQDMTRRPEALGWKVSAQVTSLGQSQEIETWSEEGAARQVKINSKTAAQTALGRVSRVLWLIPSMDRLWIEGAEGRRRFLDRMTLSFEPGHADATLAYEKAMRERNRLLKNMVREPSWYQALEVQMAQAGVVIDQNRRMALRQLAAAQLDATTAFPAAELELIHNEAPLPEGESTLRDAFADSRSRDLAAGRTLIGPHRADLIGTYRAKGVAAKDCSTGEQKALLVSLILANARALAQESGAAPLLLLDEVAAHLDADRRAALYDEITALGAQAWMTGTEKSLFDTLGDDAQYFEIIDTDGASTVRPG